MSARFYADMALAAGQVIRLPDQAARHVQVLRLQPGDPITLFNGQGEEGQFEATVENMGRSSVDVTVGSFSATRREAARSVHLAVGMPANERMDWLIEKATELGVASIRPLMAERSVLRLKGDRTEKKLAHWRGIAIAACEQCGRNRVPTIHDTGSLVQWLQGLGGPNERQATEAAVPHGDARLVLSLQAGTQPLADVAARVLAAAPTAGAGNAAFMLLSGPEGGLSPAEEAAAMAAGFVPTTLGERVLRAETAPLAVLSYLSLLPR